ncbi:DUF2076 domain-containing protein (plasmid) [Phyllobacterium sp. 628]|uniref:DUF2076 domain-containing protein n=1 Tax=Phyllobacterium sp. 628 TaxID=2718938 RepID=UPI0016628396|nr:DUF2076 domain-containing protein [Phyllobacterium sp. 628]QND55114.1 DUF2076 domain-containing protein [Phyllobacterium sp. 628]
MNADEQKLLSGLFDRTRQAADTPRDAEADRFVSDQIRSQPAAPYLLAQAVIVQEQALNACHERIQTLEAQVKDLQSAAPTQGQSGSLLGSIFGSSQSGQPSAAPSPSRSSGPWGSAAAPQDAYAPQSQPQQAGRWAAPQPSQGGGFLQGALTTAAGVAGGALMFEGIKNMFGGHSMFGGSGLGASGTPQTGGGETVVNNYYNDDSSNDLRQADAFQDETQDAADDAADAYDTNDDDDTV